MKFPALPPEVMTVTVVVPEMPPFADLPNRWTVMRALCLPRSSRSPHQSPRLWRRDATPSRGIQPREGRGGRRGASGRLAR